ncbi:hypothetical protein FXN61_10505 [Lentzea sp. PSKA42]|uniref:CD-NTase-associated protein 12/Pycsar effector protein TIR domain-containing protein n=1 Tax=Lentzea indica TaxID=2604800 RepID=A0ABX1FEF5_9PSEU|nr:hypothetical protein [Lentzea indica]NKE57242.1 hypothetical protein [Lentzea indica]
MEIRLAADVFGESPDSLIHILRLFRCFTEERHSWITDPAVIEAAEHYFQVHAPKHSASVAALGRKAVVDVMWSSPSQGRAPYEVPLIDLEDATDDLCCPAVLVVEDLVNDRHFVDALVDVFRASRISKALERDWLAVRHSGGSRLELVAMDEVGKFKIKPRVVALLDSDRLNPGEKTLSHSKANEMRAAGILVHVLELREAENYAPNRILALTGKPGITSTKLKNLKKLNSDQRGYFDMKKGFAVKNSDPAIKPTQLALYAGISPVVVAALGEGFGVNILECLHRYRAGLKVEEFDRIGAGVAQEIETLLSVIESVV